MQNRQVKYFILFIILFLFHLPGFSQEKSLAAVKIDGTIKIDGNLDDAAWVGMPEGTGFITSQPEIGKPSSHKTIVKICYDNSAIYVGAYMYDDPLKIRRQFTSRDVIERQDVDIFTVGFDTYHDRQNAYIFQVTAAGTQGDARISQNGGTGNGARNGFDRTWDAVWESSVSIKKDGWVAEIRIPYSALRFSQKPIQDWGLNFARFIRRENENSIWDPVDPREGGDVNQWGDWKGIREITPPVRLSFLPYISGGVQVSPTTKGIVTDYPKSGGMDVKWGINKSFTLDMTLVPDFAQVQSDNVYLNLSPFQVKFDDYRPFFTEGTELFNKAGLFYSRRIGAGPGGAAGILSRYGDMPDYSIQMNPGITKLYNASKLSGRTVSNLGLGLFNAVSAPMYARIHNNLNGKDSNILTEPLTNYNIFVLDQSLKNRSSLTFTNTNVLRRGNERNANVSGLDLSLFDKRNIYLFNYSGKFSSIWGATKYTGYKTDIKFGKISGLIQYEARAGMASDRYDPNDLGYLQNSNSLYIGGTVGYHLLKPKGSTLNQNFELRFNNSYLYKPFGWTNSHLMASAFFLFKSYWDIRADFVTNPWWSNDYFIDSPGYTGWYLKRSPFYYLGISGSSDSRKKVYFNYSIGGAEGPLPNDPYWTGEWGLRYRLSDKLQFSASYKLEQDKGAWGWAFGYYNADGGPIIARRRTKQNTTVLSAQYNFTPRMNWNIRLRHYWSILENTNFYTLKKDGFWNERTFINGQNINFNSFNIDMFYTWDFLPGSRMTLAWKNALGGNVNIDPYRYNNYRKNFTEMFSNPHSNEVSLKIVYYLDYLQLKRKN